MRIFARKYNIVARNECPASSRAGPRRSFVVGEGAGEVGPVLEANEWMFQARGVHPSVGMHLLPGDRLKIDERAKRADAVRSTRTRGL